MQGTFNADEVLEMAVNIERNGVKFYRKAAEGAAGKTSKAMLDMLATMEVRHEQTFAAMRDELTRVEKTSASFDPDDEASLFLKAVADAHVFNQEANPWPVLTGRESAADVLRIALGIERESILFYVGLQQLVAKTLGRDRVENIIREEMNHVSILTAELAKVS